MIEHRVATDDRRQPGELLHVQSNGLSEPHEPVIRKVRIGQDGVFTKLEEDARVDDPSDRKRGCHEPSSRGISVIARSGQATTTAAEYATWSRVTASDCSD